VKFDGSAVQSWGVGGSDLRLRVEGRFAGLAGFGVGRYFSVDMVVRLR
jgi:hypothetical protein